MLTPMPTPTPTPMQKHNEWQCKMVGSGDHDGRWQQDCNRWWQRGWTTAAQWVAGWRSDYNEQWDSSGVTEGTMGSRRLPPTQKQRNWRRRKMVGSGNHNGWQWQDCNGWQQRQWATAVQLAAGWRHHCDGQWDRGCVMDSTMGSKQLLPTQKQRNGR
jgi:hypothetical protein